MTEKTRLKNERKFIEKAKEVHGNKYDYSKVKYISAMNKVEVICSEHDSFWQNPNNHRRGSGCPKCAEVFPLDDITIIDQFKEVHGNRYDYSKVEYINAKSKVEIICSEHGSFWQTPSDHKSGSGCPECARVFPLDKVLDQFKEVHGNRYDYSKVEYINAKTKVEIVCSNHGSFWQIPSSHKRGIGCPKCAGLGLNNDDVIELFVNTHGIKYDYSKVKYINNQTKVEIVCSEHGSFWQTPDNHKNGAGCPECARVFPLDKVLYQFKEVHNNKYDYSKVEYISNQIKVEIICSEHGSFRQKPNDHKNGQGCPKCKESKGERRIREYLESKDIEYIREHKETINHEETAYNHFFDFYLPEYEAYIEYDGIQHFEPIEYFGGEETFQNTQFKDSLKDLFCENNNFKIVRIPYWDFDEIENILDKHLIKT